MVKHIQDFTFYPTPGTWHQRVTPHSWVQIQILGVGSGQCINRTRLTFAGGGTVAL